MSLLTLDKLSLAFGDAKVVKEVSFSVTPGEMLALVGESGSGKSLTALSCLGLQPGNAVAGGRVTLGGTEILTASEPQLRAVRGKRAAMIFQEPMTALNPLHTLGRQIAEIITLHSPAPLTRAALETRVGELLDQVGLAYLRERLGAFPHELSGGERQRVMIAMAIANNPELLIADEPTTAVDVTVQAKILALLKKLQRERQMAMLFITHDLTLVRHMAERVAVMKEGEIVEIGRTYDVFNAPRHPYTQKLLASEPSGAPSPVKASAPSVIGCDALKVHFPIRGGVFGRVKRHVKAVDEVTLALREGETLGVVGESGSGKSTLALALLRLIQSEGSIVFLGQETDRLTLGQTRTLRDKMQIVFQDPYASLNPRMTVRDIVAEGLRVHAPSLSPAECTAKVEQALAETGLSPQMKDRYPHEFSGGQRQRISIARAMVLNPRFIVLDEPTSALDLTVQSQMISLLRELQDKYGTSYLFISHDLRVVRALAHRIVVMRAGKIVEQGEAAALLTEPRQDYTKALLKAAFLRE